MTTDAARARLQELEAAFQVLARTNEGLAVLPQPPPGAATPVDFTVHLVGMGTPQVELRIHTQTASLTAVSGDEHASAGDCTIHDRLGVELADGFAWDASICDSAGELAGLLLKHMRRRLKTVGEVTPER
ncbi:MAG TPA: hypothetical protein VGO40_14195 [Longimicrobium sp.]|jgi:hypothetical protein|nr:hypothetical protein [Longimicrobium sp.]